MGSEEYRGQETHEAGPSVYHSRVRGHSAMRSTSGVRISQGSVLDTYEGTACDGVVEEMNSFYHKGHATRLAWIARHGDVGGPFYHRNIRISTNFPDLRLSSKGSPTDQSYTLYNGPCYPSDFWRMTQAIKAGKVDFLPTWWLDHSIKRNSLKEIGLQMMLAAQPSSPAYRCADALAELLADRSLMGVPLMDFFKRGWQGLAGEYLNLQFAILPTISDAQTIAEVTQKSQVIMAQFLREAGKYTSRRRESPTTTTSSTVVTSTTPLVMADGRGFPAAVRYGSGRFTTTTKTTRSIWFEGMFLNVMSEHASEFEKTLKKWNAVYGFAPTLKSLWEATPFSWLIDYFTNAQEFIQGTFMVGSDGTVLIRGYVMCRTHTIVEYTWTGDMLVDGLRRPHVLTWTVDEVIQQREKAHPYGLGWTGKDLTSKQLSILAALGVSMWRHKSA
jgi:hypothetical protein